MSFKNVMIYSSVFGLLFSNNISFDKDKSEIDINILDGLKVEEVYGSTSSAFDLCPNCGLSQFICNCNIDYSITKEWEIELVKYENDFFDDLTYEIVIKDINKSIGLYSKKTWSMVS